MHILVNNAGATWGAPIDEYDDVAFSKVLDLNVKGVFHLTKFLRPQLEAASTEDDPAQRHQHRLDRRHPGADDGDLRLLVGQGRGAPAHPPPGQAARAEGHASTRSRPGPFESKMMKATLESFGDSIEASAPMKRIGRPEDMAAAALYLASRGSAYVTGAIIPVDGGIATIA